MTVSPTPPVGSTTSSASSAASSAAASASAAANINFNEFLQLLVTQLQNQDPTSPTNPTQFVSQLASFAQVGQQIDTNTTLGTMLTSQALTQAEGLIGRPVLAADGTTTGTVASVNLTSAGAVQATLTNGSTITLTTGSSAGTSTTLTDGSTFSLPVGLTIG